MRLSYTALKTLLATVASVSLLCVTAGLAWAAPVLPAHAKVWKADPGIGSTITTAPTKVTVFTLESINPDPAKSNLQVYGPGPDATDALISQGNAQVSLSDSKEMSITIAPSSGHVNGVYVVFWKTVSADDGDAANGSFTFTVNTGGTNSATPAPTQNNATTPANPGGTTPAGAPIWVPIVAAIVALLIGLGAGLGLGRRKPARASIATMRNAILREDQEEKARKKP